MDDQRAAVMRWLQLASQKKVCAGIGGVKLRALFETHASVAEKRLGHLHPASNHQGEWSMTWHYV